jgi:hypothetical protein
MIHWDNATFDWRTEALPQCRNPECGIVAIANRPMNGPIGNWQSSMGSL